MSILMSFYHYKCIDLLLKFKQIKILSSILQFDNTKHCRPCGVTLPKDSYHKHIKSNRLLSITGEKM